MKSARAASATAHGPIETATLVWRAGGVFRVTLVAKASFALRHGAVAQVARAAPVAAGDELDEPSRGPRVGDELIPYLGLGAITLVGSARAPAHTPTTALAVRFGVFGEGNAPLLDKSLHVYGDVRPGARGPSAFTVMPIAWERAFGGPHVPANPVGASPPARWPNVVDARRRHEPVGFAPVSASWGARRAALARVPTVELPSSHGPALAYLELPDGFDYRAFSPAPPDQHVASVRGDEWIVLDHLVEGHPRFQAKLPGAWIEARWHLKTGEGRSAARPIPLVADLLAIDADACRATLVWRGNLAVQRPSEIASVRFEAALRTRGDGFAWPDAPASSRDVERLAQALGDHANTTTVPEPKREAPTPFATPRPAAGRRAGPTLASAGNEPEPASSHDDEDRWNATFAAEPLRIVHPVLPFASAQARHEFANASTERATPDAAPVYASPATSERDVDADIDATQAVRALGDDAAMRAGGAPFSLAKPGEVRVRDAAPIAGAPWSGVAAPAIGHVGDVGDATLVPPSPGSQGRGAPRQLGPLAFAKPVEPEPVASLVGLRGPLAGESPGAAPAPALGFAPQVMPAPPAPPPVLARPPVAAEPAPREAAELRARVVERLKAGGSFEGESLEGADLKGLDLTHASFARTDLRRANLSGAKLRGANFESANLEGAKLEGAGLQECVLTGAKLSSARAAGADFSRAQLANAELRRGDYARADFTNAVLREVFADQSDFGEAIFTGADLTSASMRMSKLPKAVFARAKLDRADLREADLRGANLFGCTKRMTKLAGANQEGVIEVDPDAR